MKAIIVTVILVLILTSCEEQLNSKIGYDYVANDPGYYSGDYIGQPTPDSTPRLFAPNIVCDGLSNRDITISPDGNQIYYTTTTSNYSFATIFVIQREKNVWSNPKVVPFGKNPDIKVIEPCLNSTGDILFYVSNKPVDDTLVGDMNIWKVNISQSGWSSPEPLPYPINTNAGEYYPSITRKGTLYFTREHEKGMNYIYRSKLLGNSYGKPEKLPQQVNCGTNRFNAYIQPDEKFIIIPAMGVEPDVTEVNYYISFRDLHDNWSDPINMGPVINNGLGRGWSASLSPDGSYLFFMSSKGMKSGEIPERLSREFLFDLQTSPQNGNADIYWVKADFIVDLKKDIIH